MTDTPTRLRVLILDDNPNDAELLVRELRRARFDPDWILVATERDYLAHLDPTLDIILADYSMPGFSGLRALGLLHQRGLDIPFILISGTVGEEIAVAAIQEGAADYLLKDRLGRLGTAITRVLEKRRLLIEREQIDRQLHRTEKQLANILEHAAEAIVAVNEDQRIIVFNKAAEKTFGYSAQEALGQPLDLLVPNRLMNVHREHVQNFAALSETSIPIEHRQGLRTKRKDGSEFPVEIGISKLETDEGIIFTAMIVDITERKRAETQIYQQIQRLNALRKIDAAITSTFDLRFTLDTLLSEVRTQLQVDAAGILLLNPEEQVLEYAAGKGFRTRAIESAHVRVGESYAGRVAQERRLVQIQNLKDQADDLLLTTWLAGEDFACYYGVPLITKGKVKGVLEIFHRAPLQPYPDWLDFLDTLAGQAAIAIDSAELFKNLQRSNADLMLAYDATIEGWSRALDLRDKETEGHTLRVTEMVMNLTQTYGFSDEELLQIRWGALLHDIGKMGVPDHILLKREPITPEEQIIMQRHPQYAYDLLQPITFLKSALDIPYYHHEKWDGTGYPGGLKGEEIPIAARLFAVVDVWDALTSDRPYRQAWSREEALAYIREQSGKHFDPQVVDLFFKVIG